MESTQWLSKMDWVSLLIELLCANSFLSHKMSFEDYPDGDAVLHDR